MIEKRGGLPFEVRAQGMQRREGCRALAGQIERWVHRPWQLIMIRVFGMDADVARQLWGDCIKRGRCGCRHVNFKQLLLLALQGPLPAVVMMASAFALSPFRVRDDNTTMCLRSPLYCSSTCPTQ